MTYTVNLSLDSDKTEVCLGSSRIIPQSLKEKQRFSVQAVDFIIAMWAVYDSVPQCFGLN